MIVWHIGDVIKKLRERYRDPETGIVGLTQGEFADKIGIAGNTLSLVERNVSNYSRETLEKIAAGFQMTIEGLFALLPGASVPITTDPIDAETLARYLQLTPEDRRTVRIVVDQLGRFPDRSTLGGNADANARPTPKSGT